jgi:carbamoylphosphate synthase large subunit
MNANIRCLIVACKLLNLTYTSFHSSGNLVEVDVNNQKHVFVNWCIPLQTHSNAKLYQDKEYSYKYFSKLVAFPKQISFLNFDCSPEFSSYVRCKDITNISKEISLNFKSFPLIVKRNRGSGGSGVFVCQDLENALEKIVAIFNTKSEFHDYVALVQERINISKEFRVIVFLGEIFFAYLKDNSSASFTGNLSPLHWEGATARICSTVELEYLKEFLKPILSKITYAGIDVAIDNDNKAWIIEINGSPSYEIFTQKCGDALVVGLYKQILEEMKRSL